MFQFYNATNSEAAKMTPYPCQLMFHLLNYRARVTSAIPGNTLITLSLWVAAFAIIKCANMNVR